MIRDLKVVEKELLERRCNAEERKILGIDASNLKISHSWRVEVLEKETRVSSLSRFWRRIEEEIVEVGQIHWFNDVDQSRLFRT